MAVSSDAKEAKELATAAGPVSPESPSDNHADSKDVDLAFRYLQSHRDAERETQGDHVYTSSLRRKIDWRIVPIMFCCYTMQFVDKVLLNYAAVMGLRIDLDLIGNDFSNAASAFFIAYLIAEIPNGYFIQMVSPSKWLGANVALWGIACACTAGAFNYHSLVAARVFLGIFEAAISPSLMIISSNWYDKSEQGPRFALWYCGLGLGQIIGGLISFAFQKVHHPAFAGWRIMFLVLGIVTVIVGVATFFTLPDAPMEAKFLTETEKVAVIKHVSVNQTGMKNKHFKLSHILEILIDPQIWLLVVITILISISSGVITTFSATLISSFGFSPPVSALLNMPSGLVSIAFTLFVGYGIRRASNRWLWLVASCIPGIIGGALMSFMPARNRAGLLAGIYLVNAVVASLIVLYHWTTANCAGQTKRVVASALVSGAFSLGNIIGPQTFQAKEAPAYPSAKITVVATQAAGAFLTVVLFAYYKWANMRKSTLASLSNGDAQLSSDERALVWGDMTDRQNSTFRYSY